MMAILTVILPYSMSFHAADDIAINKGSIDRKPVSTKARRKLL